MNKTIGKRREGTPAAAQHMGEWCAAHERRPPAPPMRLLIPVLIVAAIVLIPVVYLAVRAGEAGPSAWEFLFRERTLSILGNSLILVVSVTLASVLIAVPTAWIVTRSDVPMRRLWALLTPLPLVIPSYVAGYLFVVTLGPRGSISTWFMDIAGAKAVPDLYGFWGAWFVLTVLSYPYVLLPVRAALHRFDPQLAETSLSLGKSSWETFKRVTIPLVTPSIGAGTVLVALYTLSDFGAVSLLGFETFTWAIYIQYESALDRSLSAVLGLILILIALGVVFLEGRARSATPFYRADPGSVKPAPKVPLGRWRWPAFFFCAALSFFSLIAPLTVLLHWVIRGLSAGEVVPELWSATWNSLFVSALAAIATVAMTIPVVYLSVRYTRRFGMFLERICCVGFALPGIVVALGFVAAASQLLTPFYQTLGLLVLAYVVLFMQPSVGTLRSTLLQLSPRLEDSARSLGRGPLGVFRTITLPLLAPGIFSGAALVFLLTMKELPATLILSPLGFSSLATKTWSAAAEAYFAQAAIPALFIVIMSSLPLAVLLVAPRLERRALVGKSTA